MPGAGGTRPRRARPLPGGSRVPGRWRGGSLREVRGALPAAEARTLAARRDIEEARRALTAAGRPSRGRAARRRDRPPLHLDGPAAAAGADAAPTGADVERAREACRAERASVTGAWATSRWKRSPCRRWTSCCGSRVTRSSTARTCAPWTPSSRAQGRVSRRKRRHASARPLPAERVAAPSRTGPPRPARARRARRRGSGRRGRCRPGGLVHPAGWALVAAAAVLLGRAVGAGAGSGRPSQEEYARLRLMPPCAGSRTRTQLIEHWRRGSNRPATRTPGRTTRGGGAPPAICRCGRGDRSAAGGSRGTWGSRRSGRGCRGMALPARARWQVARSRRPPGGGGAAHDGAAARAGVRRR